MNSDMLRARWTGEHQRIQAILDDIQDKKDWTKNLLAAEGLWGELSHIGSCRRPRLATEAAPRDLRGIFLEGVSLAESQHLADTDLDFAELRGVSLRGASLRGTSFRYGQVSNGTICDRANMEYCHCEGAVFRDASLKGVNFTGANIRGATFRNCDLSEANFFQVSFTGASAVSISRFRRTRFESDSQTTKIWSAVSDSTLRRYARIEIAKSRIRSSHPVLAALDLVLTNYGRSPLRLFLWAIIVWLCFGEVFGSHSLPASFEGTTLGSILCSVHPEFIEGASGKVLHLRGIEPFYLSAITLVGFGHSSIVPAPRDVAAHVWVLVEIVIGFIFLGGIAALLVQNVWIMEE